MMTSQQIQYGGPPPYWKPSFGYISTSDYRINVKFFRIKQNDVLTQDTYDLSCLQILCVTYSHIWKQNIMLWPFNVCRVRFQITVISPVSPAEQVVLHLLTIIIILRDTTGRFYRKQIARQHSYAFVLHNIFGQGKTWSTVTKLSQPCKIWLYCVRAPSRSQNLGVLGLAPLTMGRYYSTT